MIRSGPVGIAKKQQASISGTLVRASLVPLAVAAYAYTLHWIYLNLITDNFYYLGYGYSTPDSYAVIFTYLAAAALALILPGRLRAPSDILLWILYVVAIAPAILIPPYAGYQDGNEATLAGLGIALAYAIATLGARRHHEAPLKPLFKPISETSFWITVSIYSLFVYLMIYFTLGLSLDFVALLDVYDQREEYREGLAGGSAIVGYLVSTQANVVNPLIIANGLLKRRWYLLALGFLGQAVLYSGTGFKTVLFSVPAILVFAFILRNGRQIRTAWLLWGGVGVAAIAAVVDEIQGGIIWTSLFSRRFLITPGILTAVYMKYFSDNPKALLSNSVLEGITTDHYGLPPARVIGYHMTANPDSAANANIFADGFANFGAAGVLGAAIILAVYLRFLDRASAGLPLSVSGLVVIMPAVALSNTSMLTGLLSHGLVAAVLLLAIHPRAQASRLEGGPALSPSMAPSRPIPTHRRHRSPSRHLTQR